MIRLRDWLPEDHLVYFVSDLIDDEDLSALFVQVLAVCQEARLTKLGHVALDCMASVICWKGSMRHVVLHLDSPIRTAIMPLSVRHDANRK